MELNKIYCGDSLEVLKTFPDNSIDCVVTSPPYFSLRSYLPDEHPDKDKEVGFGQTPDEYVDHLVTLLREARRILKDSGSMYLNIGDSYSNGGRSYYAPDKRWAGARQSNARAPDPAYIKPKDLMGIPWMCAFALRSDGWYLRSDIIYEKRNCMPQSVTDRPTSSHEHVFLLTKSQKYYYDWEAIATEPSNSYAKDKRPEGVIRQKVNANSKYHADCDVKIVNQFRKQDGVERGQITKDLMIGTIQYPRSGEGMSGH